MSCTGVKSVSIKKVRVNVKECDRYLSIMRMSRNVTQGKSLRKMSCGHKDECPNHIVSGAAVAPQTQLEPK
jgi:hypothetical protein